MASKNTCPVVQPLPRFIVQLGLAVGFVLGHLLLWNDRRIAKTGIEIDTEVQKPMGLPAYK